MAQVPDPKLFNSLQYMGFPMINGAMPKKEEIDYEDADYSLSAVYPGLTDPPSTSSLPPARQRVKRTRASKNRSQFLRYFTDSDDPSQLNCVICNVKVRYMYGTKKVTSSLRDHLTAHHSDVMDDLVDGDARHDQAQSSLLRAMANGDISLTSIDSPEMRAFMKALDPTFVFPVPELFTTVLDDEYKSIVTQVTLSLLGQEAAISVDDWKHQWGMTASFIDSEWERQFVVLPVMKNERPLTIIFGCILHAVDTFVNESFANFEEGRNLIGRISTLARYLRTNEKAWEDLRKKLVDARCNEKSQLPIDYEGSWDSTLRMMKMAKVQMAHLDESFLAAGVVPLKGQECEMIDKIAYFLGEVEDFCIKMSTHDATLSSLIPYIEGLDRTIDEFKSGPLCVFHPHLRVQFNRLLAPSKLDPVVRRAYLLDPRFLHLGCLDAATRASDLNELFKAADEGFNSEEPEEPQKKKTRSNLLAKAFSEEQLLRGSHAQREYDMLFDIACKSDLAEDADICEFWRTHQDRLSRLSSIARRLLAIPPSSIPANRFSSQMGTVATQLAIVDEPSQPDQRRKLLFIGTDNKKRMLRFRDSEDYRAFFEDEHRLNDALQQKV
ncbi:hypothetical protein PRIPAC_91677 [Pristionchus pacificus]|uniref:Dimer_Tnp_hAT domain-containing protein n=1 Tax=Pristionchus pacificus TaxID=54126 RepID=A0A2A6BPN3_PRIPA|nr:hypothetical protein PRIPAC_91677 [Pristionchus pacificus]|eukprot:PDM67867.1 hypothetical protein PRIPAC_45911 [Pristionchus pacificus]